MRRLQVLLLIVLVWTFPASAQETSPWQEVIPLMQFGYGNLQSVYWSPVTGQLATHSVSGIQFYDEALNLEARRWFTEGEIYDVEFSPNFEYAAVNEAQGLIVRDTETWHPVLAISNFQSPSWSPDSQLLAVWVGPRLQVWDVARAEVVLQVDELVSDGGAVQWSPDSQVVAIPAANTIIMLNARTGDIVRVHDVGMVNDFVWSFDGRWFAIIGLEVPPPRDYDLDLLPLELMRMDALTGEIVMKYDVTGSSTGDYYTATFPVAISPNGQYISARLSSSPELDGNDAYWRERGMYLWDLQTGTPSRSPFPVTYTSWSPDGTQFASSISESLEIYDVASGARVSLMPAYLGSGTPIIWTGSEDQVVVRNGLWDISEGQAEFIGVRSIDEPPHDIFQPTIPFCNNTDTRYCPENIAYDPARYDYDKPPWTFELINYIPERQYAITYEVEIEYPGTPEYEDGEPPWERFALIDLNTGEHMEEHLNMTGEQTAYIYDHPDAHYIDSESRAFNVRRNSDLLAIDDDEIMNVRTQEVWPLQGVERWEWREVWFSPDDGARVYAYDTDYRFKAFDPQTGEMLYQTVPAPRNEMSFSRDYKLTYITDNRSTVHIYDTETGTPILELYTGNQGQRYLWNEDRTLLAVGGENMGIIIIDVARQERLAVLRGHHSGISRMSWNPHCDYDDIRSCRFVLASTDNNGTVTLWGFEESRQDAPEIALVPPPNINPLPEPEVDFATLEPLWAYLSTTDQYGRPAVQSVRWTPQGIRINSDEYYTPDLSRLDEMPEGFNATRPRDVLANGRAVLPNGAILNPDGSLLARVTGQAYDAVFSPGGDRVLTAEGASVVDKITGWVGEYSAESGQPIVRWGGGNPGFSHIEYSPDDQWIATVTVPYFKAAGRVQIWYADRWNTQYSSLIGHTDSITALYWDGGDVLTASLDGSVRRWDIHTGYPLARWNHPENAPITQMEWLNDDQLILSAGNDLFILDAATLQEQRQIAGVGGRSFDWSPDRQQLITIGGDWLVRIVDFDTGDVLAQESSHMPSVSLLAWNPDGSELAVARRDGSIGILDGESGQQTRVLRLGGLEVEAMKWSPDGRYLLLDRLDNVIEILDGQSGQAVSEIYDPWRRDVVEWSPDSQHLAYATFPDPNEGVYDASSWLKVVSLDGALIQVFDMGWRDFIFYWNKKPIALSFSPDGAYIGAFYDDHASIWNLATGDHIESGEAPLSSGVVLANWTDAGVTFYTARDTYRLGLDGSLQHLKESGLPDGSTPRPDGQLVFGNQMVIDVATEYPFQAFNQYQGGEVVAWHPTCWTSECQSVLAIGQGSQVIMYGYPQKDS